MMGGVWPPGDRRPVRGVTLTIAVWVAQGASRSRPPALDVPLRRRQGVTEARVECRGGVERAAEGLKDRLDFVMGIAAVVQQDVDIHPRLARDAVEEMPDHLRAEAADRRAGEVGLHDAVAAPAEIDRHR